MSDVKSLGIGKIITTPQQRDAIHSAIAPVIAGEDMNPGSHIGIHEGKAFQEREKLPAIGVADPFYKRMIQRGQEFWLFLYPGSITSLRHNWTHPAFEPESPRQSTLKSVSEQWMRAWAVKHMSEDYYSSEDRTKSEDEAYESAIEAGRNLHIGPYEDARDYIDNEWWTHWENITGETGQRGEYFSCSC